MPSVDSNRLEHAYHTAFKALLAERNPDGYWTGELSASALATATAISAMVSVDKKSRLHQNHQEIISKGIAWLAEHQSPDGGWGDTVQSLSNISTTMLCRAAFHLTGTASTHGPCLERASNYVKEHFGKTAEEQAESVRARYGKDRTFAVPILSTCALAGIVEWREVKPLPFELACLPQEMFRFLRLPVVSYALPALIAVGQLVYHYRPPWNPILRLIRRLAINKSLRVLESIQPESGGFLEAVPLTSFVTLSLAAIGLADHPVARQGVRFIENSVRPDGSWPIDSNLCVWVTTLAVNALAAAGELPNLEKRDRLRQWLLGQQFTSWHPYTGAKPGGWGWTDLPGSVPDGDDTAGALLALSHVLEFVEDEAPNPSPRAILRRTLEDRGADPTQVAKLPRLVDVSFENRPAIQDGLHWLLDLQNRDGGWPTFCRGWGKLPFDRSGADLTAHALRALAAWRLQQEADQIYHWACRGQFHFAGFPFSRFHAYLTFGLEYLESQQNSDGSWTPLWFGNQYSEDEENPTYGTARVLAAYRDLDMINDECARRGIEWLLRAQNLDGSWGGAPNTPGSIEETALAVEILLASGPENRSVVNKGLAWLVEQVEKGALSRPTPIGFYFAKLWYFEKLYPIIFTVAALGRARKQEDGST
jgi:squalene-hopene/tetraprenyl-beta-curcumene cyclase